MIECTYQVVAVYVSGEAESLAPVLAWGDAGEPYILGPQGLTLASKEAGFQGIRFANDQPQGPVDPTDPAPVVTKPREKDRENGR
ncbi:MAG TPA: hypothetical protein VFL72_05525 [Acidimicrobiia bacterium]|nr:hypothetical protein [Acidimicrobiia bacterium]